MHRAKANVAQMTRCTMKQQCLSYDESFKLFDAKVTSTLLCSADLWGLANSSEIESTHLRLMKKFLNIQAKSLYLMVCGKCRRYFMYINASIRSSAGPGGSWVRIGVGGLMVRSSAEAHLRL